jgi:hypothetical protein
VPNEKLAIAVYGFRSKQEYIYRTNRIKEIMGASKIIEDAFDEVIRGSRDSRDDCYIEDIAAKKNPYCLPDVLCRVGSQQLISGNDEPTILCGMTFCPIFSKERTEMRKMPVIVRDKSIPMVDAVCSNKDICVIKVNTVGFEC